MILRQDRVLALVLVPLAAIAVLAVVHPVVLLRSLGGPARRGAPKQEAFLRAAGAMLLIGALVVWYRVWKS